MSREQDLKLALENFILTSPIAADGTNLGEASRRIEEYNKSTEQNTLSLDNLGLVDVSIGRVFSLLDSGAELDLSNNNLKDIPDDVLEKFSTVKLDNNIIAPQTLKKLQKRAQEFGTKISIEYTDPSKIIASYSQEKIENNQDNIAAEDDSLQGKYEQVAQKMLDYQKRSFVQRYEEESVCDHGGLRRC